MPDLGWLRRLRAMPNDHPAKILLVVGGVALFCSLVVSSTAVLLEPHRLANMEREHEQHLLEILERIPGLELLLEAGEGRHVEARLVDLETGEELDLGDPQEFDPREAALDPSRSIALAPERDIAGIERRANHAIVYRVERNRRLELLILPVYGAGYVSTLYGYATLAGDANTLLDVSFYEHSETPGLGSQVDSPEWRERWRGKRVRDEQGRLRIRVALAPVDPDSPDAAYTVDGLSGATRTSQGVSDLLRFWLGDDGFG
ncbi:MAG: NADH:ubiquinone reductase (Na(+)-transporting) subunit C, partial [Myxococcota bacterium]